MSDGRLFLSAIIIIIIIIITTTKTGCLTLSYGIIVFWLSAATNYWFLQRFISTMKWKHCCCMR